MSTEAQPADRLATPAPSPAEDASPQNGLPYRTRPREADAETLARWNEGRPDGTRIAEGAAEEIERIARSSYVAQTQDLHTWIHHPDERVPLALMERFGIVLSDLSGTRTLLYQRAMNGAAGEGMLWTPLLDSLRGLHVWPTRDRRHTAHPDGSWTNEHGVRIIGPEYVEVPIVQWLRHEGRKEQEALGLTEYPPRSPAFRWLASHAALTPGLTRAILDRAPAQAVNLASSVRLKPESVAVLEQWCIERLFAEANGGHDGLRMFESLERAGRQTSQDFRERLLRMVDDRTAGHWTAFQILHQMTRPSLCAAEIRRLAVALRGTVSMATVAEWLARPEATADLREWLRRQEHENNSLASAILECRESRAEDLLWAAPRIVGSSGKERDAATRLLNHPSADAALWRWLASRAGNLTTRLALAHHEGARSVSEVRRQLGRSRSPQMLLALMRAPGIPAEEWRGYFRRVASSDPRAALDLLRERGLPAGMDMAPADLLPLLRSDDVQIREEAMRVAPSLLGSANPPAAHESEHAPPRTGKRRR